jgi:DnaJ like chaperone protein
MKGKIIGALVGVWLLNIPGFFLGLIAGHFYDSLQRLTRGHFVHLSAEQRAAIQHSYFETTFKLLGYLAKADGHVSKAEVSHTEELMSRMGLSAAQRQEAIQLFKQGSAEGFSLSATLIQFNQICGKQPRLKQTLLSYLITLAMADGNVDAQERNALLEIANGLGIPSFVFEQLLSMIQAQASFHQQGGSYGGTRESTAGNLDKAYQALGVEASASDTEIKKAYRKLISENHPDKLIGQGMPEEMIKLATERSQEISSAYELIQKSRGS